MSKKYKVSTDELEFEVENLIEKRNKLIEDRTYLDDLTYKNSPTQKEIETRVQIKHIRANLRQRALNKKHKDMSKFDKHKQEYEILYNKLTEKKDKLDEEKRIFYAKVALDKKIDDIIKTQDLILENQRIIMKNLNIYGDDKTNNKKKFP